MSALKSKCEDKYVIVKWLKNKERFQEFVSQIKHSVFFHCPQMQGISYWILATPVPHHAADSWWPERAERADKLTRDKIRLPTKSEKRYNMSLRTPIPNRKVSIQGWLTTNQLSQFSTSSCSFNWTSSGWGSHICDPWLGHLFINYLEWPCENIKYGEPP